MTKRGNTEGPTALFTPSVTTAEIFAAPIVQPPGEVGHRVIVTGGFTRLPVVYIRAGLPPTDAAGEQVSSFSGRAAIDTPHGAKPEEELGVSVLSAWHDPKTKKYVVQGGGELLETDIGEIQNRPMYLVTGEDTGETDASGSTLLKPGTIKILQQLNPDDMVSETVLDTTFAGRGLSDTETPFIPAR